MGQASYFDTPSLAVPLPVGAVNYRRPSVKVLPPDWDASTRVNMDVMNPPSNGNPEALMTRLRRQSADPGYRGMPFPLDMPLVGPDEVSMAGNSPVSMAPYGVDTAICGPLFPAPFSAPGLSGTSGPGNSASQLHLSPMAGLSGLPVQSPFLSPGAMMLLQQQEPHLQQQQPMPHSVGPYSPVRYQPGQQQLPTSPTQLGRPLHPRKLSVVSDCGSNEAKPHMDGTASSQPHKMDREMKKMNLYKTELCRSWEETGTCRYGNKCQFAHSESELRPVDRHPKYKTEMCKTFWEKGTCPYGKRCCFIHTERDVEKKMYDIDKKLIVIRKQSEDKTAGVTRPRTMSLGQESVRTASDSSPDDGQPPVESSLTAPQNIPLAPAHEYDTRAIAEAYFSGRRHSDVAPMADDFMSSLSPDDTLGGLTRMLQATRLGAGSVPAAQSALANYHEQRRVSLADFRPDFYMPNSSNAMGYGHASSAGQLPLMPDPALYESFAVSGHLTSPVSLSTPPRERTKRSRSATQPTLIPPSQPWSKSRSESFSGYLPGNPELGLGLGTEQFAPHYPGSYSASHVPYAYAPNAKGLTYGPQGLMSPPPSGHASPVRDVIIEEEIGSEEEDGLNNHRLAFFKNIKSI
ncbi:hypothetical protein HDU85_006848 [Gaertneriomyces sp. JEL0708]|nr:hypothetical protein HDU85_006848 [Gaertneriomyces sp. JEL0708]